MSKRKPDITCFFPRKKRTLDLPEDMEKFLEQKVQESFKKKLPASIITTEENPSLTGKDEAATIIALKKELNCANEKLAELQKVTFTQKNDIKALKTLLNASNKLCVSKDLKIQQLKKRNTPEEKNILFASFEKDVGLEVLKEMRKVPEGKKSDSQFIHSIVRLLHPELRDLVNKSAVGTMGKEPISPKKKDFILKMWEERLLSEEKDADAMQKRMKNVNHLINTAIYNHNRTYNTVRSSSGPPPLVLLTHKD